MIHYTNAKPARRETTQQLRSPQKRLPDEPPQKQWKVTPHIDPDPSCLLLRLCCTSPHYPLNQAWQIVNTAMGNTTNSTSHLASLGTCFPDLHLDLCDLVDEEWEPSGQQPFSGYSCNLPGVKGTHSVSQAFYICPGHSQDWSQWSRVLLLHSMG